MKVYTWKPGSNKDLDYLFNELRLIQFYDKTHRLWFNYSEEFVSFCVALTICLDDDNHPTICSSISSRTCWPKNVFRILNRTWKPNTRMPIAKKLSKYWIGTVQSQFDYLKENTNYKIAFISRQTGNWENWLATNLNEKGFKFKTDKYYYLTCPNECDETCWQKIIYQGDARSMKSWKKKGNNHV